MNITHAVDEKIDGDKLFAIFNRQKELMEKYHDIEARSGLMQTEDCPVNLDDKRGQARIKDFSWRVMEEVGEALDAFRSNDMEHYCEELIDGLHFLTELTILSGYYATDVSGSYFDEKEDCLDCLYKFSYVGDNEPIAPMIAKLVEDLGMMCNCLKNKAWKQTSMLTDKENYYKHLKAVWVDYIRLLSTKLTSDEIANVYLKKSQVNKFRQRSNY